MTPKPHLEIHEVTRSEASEKRRWMDKMLKNPTAMLILGLAIASGFLKIVLPALFIYLGVPGGSPLSQIVDHNHGADQPQGGNAQMVMPPCATAMRDMREAMVALKTTVEGQDKRIQELTTSVTEGFKAANLRIDNLLLNGKRSQAGYDRTAARERTGAALKPNHDQVLDQLMDKAAAAGDLVRLNDTESRIR